MVKASNTHGGFAGRTLQDKIRALMDKQNGRIRKIMGERYNQNDELEVHKHELKLQLAIGRFEGMCATLAILRSSSIDAEKELSNERCGYA